MTTPKPVVLWSYATLEESADEASSPPPATARYDPAERLPDPRRELLLEVEGVRFGPGEEVRFPPLEERLRRLTACARERTGPHAERCLAHLAVLDRPAAVELAHQWNQAEVLEGALPLVRALLTFPSTHALEAYLDGLGLTDQLHLELAEHEERPITLQELLLLRGRAHVFPLSRRQHAVRHDELLSELASLAPEVLDGLLLEELPAVEDRLEDEELEDERDEEEEDGREDADEQRLVARGTGRRYEAPARGEFSFEDDADFIDAGAVLDFLNALARARGSDVRWVLFDTDGESCVVVAGPALALEALQEKGLIPSSSPEQLRALEARYGR